MKKRILALLIAGIMAAGLCACGGRQEAPAEEVEDIEVAAIAPKDLKIGMVLIGEAADSFDDGHTEGMRAACEACGIDYETQVVTRSNVGEDAGCVGILKELADAGCNIIFCDSFGHEQYVVDVAPEYPDVQFCSATGYQSSMDGLDNTHNYFCKIFEARYLSGIAAGMKTETNVLGYVAAKPYAEVISGYTAFYLGAKSVNPDVTMLVNYTNTWGDPAKEAVNAQDLIDRGCDVISQHTNTFAPSTIAQTNGAFSVGYNNDMIPVSPKAALVSACVNWGVYYTYALNCLLEGAPISQDWCGSYADGACYLSDYNEPIFPEGAAEAIDLAAAGLADGSVKVFSGPLKGADADGNTLELAEGESYTENEFASSPSFAYIVEGITVLP